MNNNKSKPLYFIFGLVIVVLLALIGYFAYLLVSPSTPTNTNTNTNATANANKNKNSNSNKNSNANATNNSNANTNADEDEGLVEPSNSNANSNSNSNSNKNSNTNSADEDEDEADDVVAGEGEEVITLYFAKTGSSCGEVYPVKRAVTPAEDFYGQIMLADLAGPTDDEDDYVNKASGVRLRWVEYTSEGSKVYVNEAYDALSACDKETAEAQLIHTANTMFEVSPTAEGEVIVGYPDEDEEEEETDNSNTNSEE